MNKTELNETSNAEMVTISRAEYEEFQAQRKKISELESRVDVLMEALRLARPSSSVLPLKRVKIRSWNS